MLGIEQELQPGRGLYPILGTKVAVAPDTIKRSRPAGSAKSRPLCVTNIERKRFFQTISRWKSSIWSVLQGDKAGEATVKEKGGYAKSATP